MSAAYIVRLASFICKASSLIVYFECIYHPLPMRYNEGTLGEWEFSFDKKTVFNLFQDYPHKLSKEQKELFDRENPDWRDFFSDRK